MKKLIYFAIVAATALFMSSCQPEVMKGPGAWTAISAQDLKLVVDGQYSDEECTQAKADGNYIKYHMDPAVPVQVYNIKRDGSKRILATGSAGSFRVQPGLGADPVQKIYMQAINQDASIVVNETTVTVNVPTVLAPEVEILTGPKGTQAWTYYPIGGATWGNCGYIGVGGQANVAAGEIPGQWWGCVPEDLEDSQIKHTGGIAYGYGSSDAYMEFYDDGDCISYDKDGKIIASGSYNLKNYDATAAKDGYLYGKLVTDNAPVLYPFAVNTGGQKVNEFEVIYINNEFMSLIYQQGNSTWNWGESTWWRFKHK